MKKITPSERISKEIRELLSGSITAENGGGLLPRFALLAMQRLLQELLEGEQADFLGREHYEHKSGASGWRNGYEPGHTQNQ